MKDLVRNCESCGNEFRYLNRERTCTKCFINKDRKTPFKRSECFKKREPILVPLIKEHLTWYFKAHHMPIQLRWVNREIWGHDGTMRGSFGTLRLSLGGKFTRKGQIRLYLTEEGTPVAVPRCGRVWIDRRSFRKSRKWQTVTNANPVLRDGKVCECRTCKVSMALNMTFRDIDGLDPMLESPYIGEDGTSHRQESTDAPSRGCASTTS